MILRQCEEITGQLEQEFYSLEKVLKEIARERGKWYHVTDWKTRYEVLSLEGDKTPTFSNFGGYKMKYGLLFRETILLATFDAPENHLLRRPEGAGEDYRFLALSYDPFYFSEQQLGERLRGTFPQRDFHFDIY